MIQIWEVLYAVNQTARIEVRPAMYRLQCGNLHTASGTVVKCDKWNIGWGKNTDARLLGLEMVDFVRGGCGES